MRQAREQAAAAGEVPRAGHQGRVLSRHHPPHIPGAGLINVNRWNIYFSIDATLRTYRPCAVTLLATEATELTNTLLADTDKTELVSEEDRTISACSTLEGDEELQSDTESLL